MFAKDLRDAIAALSLMVIISVARSFSVGARPKSRSCSTPGTRCPREGDPRREVGRAHQPGAGGV